jgi:hypothetical protein
MIRKQDRRSSSEADPRFEAGTRGDGSATDPQTPDVHAAQPDPLTEQSVLKVDDGILHWVRAGPTDHEEPSPPDQGERRETNPSSTDSAVNSREALRRWVAVLQDQLRELPAIVEEHVAALRNREADSNGNLDKRVSQLEEGISTLRSTSELRMAELARELAEISADAEQRIETSVRAIEHRVRELAASELQIGFAEAERRAEDHALAVDERIARVQQAGADLAASLKGALAKTAEDLDAQILDKSSRIDARLEEIDGRMEQMTLSIEHRLGAFGTRIQSMLALFKQVARALDANIQADDISGSISPSTKEQAPGRIGMGSSQAFES